MRLVPALVKLVLERGSIVVQRNLVEVVEVACRKELGLELLAFHIEVVGVVRIVVVRTRVEGQGQRFVVVGRIEVEGQRFVVVQMIAVVHIEVVRMIAVVRIGVVRIEVVRIEVVRTRVVVAQEVSIRQVEGRPNYHHPIRKRFVRQT